MDYNALSYIHSKDGLAKESSGGYQNIHYGNDMNDPIPIDLLPPNYPLHIKGTVAPFKVHETHEAVGGETSDDDEEEQLDDPNIGGNCLEVGGNNRTQSLEVLNNEEEGGAIDAEELAIPYTGDNKFKVPGVDKKGGQQQISGTPLEVHHADIAGSTSIAPTKKWSFRPTHAVLITLLTCMVTAMIISVVLSSRNPAPRMSPEEIACNFIARPNLVDCRSTVEVTASSSNAAGVRIPSEIRVLTQLTHLELDLSELIGTIPSTLSNLSRLNFLSLYVNKLTGTIPPLATLSQLTYLNLGHNELAGSIPSLSNLSKLDSLSVGNNQLTGTIPALSNLALLTSLELEENQLIGTIPSLSNLSQLSTLLLYDTQLSGTMPSYLCSLQGISIVIDCGEITCDPNCCSCW
ncbi:hypothetical protein MHU86_1363 [Fragilaria crotonensis]|nr:hypothetical protein MHU86_1363 [Fragilaria crotonensis]